MPHLKPVDTHEPARRVYPSDLTEAEWRYLEPLLPMTHPRGQKRIHSYREVINGLRYVLRNGCVWRAMPHDLPPWQTVYYYFRTWQEDNTFKRLYDAIMSAEHEQGTPAGSAHRYLRKSGGEDT